MLVTELSSPTGSKILAAGLARNSSFQGLGRSSSGNKNSLEDLTHGSDAVLVYEESSAAQIEESGTALWNEIPTSETAFIVLVPRVEPPIADSQYDSPACSFLCSTPVFHQLLHLGIDCYPETLCFAILHAVAHGDIDVGKLLVRQIPCAETIANAHAIRPTAVVLPHRGNPVFLRASLKYLGRCAGQCLQVRVGLDEEDTAAYTSFPAEYCHADFFHFTPAPVGPYVIRQELADRSPEPVLALQDSDDLSTWDRFTMLNDTLAESGADIVGSHELCLDEMRALVQPVRFPLDSSASLDIRANHALLHGSLACRREAFFGAGGLATNLIIASDTQFLLRAYFSARIRNVDEFLYIRRRHAGSLTNDPETIYDNPLRRRLNEDWRRDFDLVKRGELALEASSLWPERRLEPLQITTLHKVRRPALAELK